MFVIDSNSMALMMFIDWFRKLGLEQSSTLDGNGRALFSTSTKTDDGTAAKKTDTAQNQKTSASSFAKSPTGEHIADTKILRTLASYLWMKDNLEFRFRVIAALGFLVGAKVSDLTSMIAYLGGIWFVF